MQVNEAGHLLVVDRNGTKRYSSKDSTQGMSIGEFFDELKTHEIAQNFFESAPGQSIDRSDNQPPRWQDANSSPAERLTRARLEQQK